MKKLFVLAVLSDIALLSSCVITSGNGHSNIKYTPLPPEGKNMPVEAFNSIKANGVFNLFLTKGTTESVVVKGNFPEDLKVVAKGNSLIIMDTVSDRNHMDSLKTNIYVTYKQLDHLEIEMVGKTQVLDTIRADKFNFESYGVGESSLLLNADSAEIFVSGVGAVNIAGRARNASLNDDGVGALKAKNFIADSLSVVLNGVGAADVYATRALYMHVDGVGGVTYYGPAKVVVQESTGIGKIEHGT
jgi:Putative auto-transporter adhesin, head GIN domain